MIRVRGGYITSSSFVLLQLVVSEIAKCTACGYLLFTTLFAVTISVCTLKSMCIPSFILIVCCVSPIKMYGLRVFIENYIVL